MTGYAVNRLAPIVVHFVQGPDGFTESFDARTVDVLVRMGFIELEAADDPNNGDRVQYKTYIPTGRRLVK